MNQKDHWDPWKTLKETYSELILYLDKKIEYWTKFFKGISCQSLEWSSFSSNVNGVMHRTHQPSHTLQIRPST